MTYKIDSITMRIDDRHVADDTTYKVLVAVVTFTYANVMYSVATDIDTMLKVTFDGSNYISSDKVDPSIITKDTIDKAVEKAIKKEIENINLRKKTSADEYSIRAAKYPYSSF